MIPKPKAFADFVGPAATVGKMWQAKLARITREDTVKSIFWGPPGTGKTALARLIADQLCGHPISIEHINGQSCTVDLVREWAFSAPLAPLFGVRKVKLVDECDLMSPAAMHEVLTYLDRLPSHCAFLCTTNKTLDDLPKRFHSRMAQYQVAPPSTADIGTLLRRHFPELNGASAMLAMGACGDVRAALNDADAYLDKLVLD